MDLGIALDGTGRLGLPAAVTTLARAADRLGYGSVWCIGPWAPTLAGAVAVVTRRVRIGLEAGGQAALVAGRTVAADRLVVLERLPLWSPAQGDPVRAPAGPVRLDARASAISSALERLAAARTLGVTEVVVRLVDDPQVDQALAVYAELGELLEALAAGA